MRRLDVRQRFLKGEDDGNFEIGQAEEDSRSEPKANEEAERSGTGSRVRGIRPAYIQASCSFDKQSANLRRRPLLCDISNLASESRAATCSRAPPRTPLCHQTSVSLVSLPESIPCVQSQPSLIARYNFYLHLLPGSVKLNRTTEYFFVYFLFYNFFNSFLQSFNSKTFISIGQFVVFFYASLF